MLLVRFGAGARAGEDRRRRLRAQILERLPRILARGEPRRARLDEPAHERPVLVERGPSVRAVLLERERQIGPGLEVGREDGERAEAEPPQRLVKVRSLHRNPLLTRVRPRLLRRPGTWRTSTRCE